MAIKIRKPFEASVKVTVDCRVLNPKTGEFEYRTQTKQADAAACDINNIMNRFERTGQLPDMIRRDGRYGDFSDAPSYQEALGIVAHAHEQFMALDAKVRDRFANDPEKMLRFVQDPANREEMVKLGLAVARPATPPKEPDAKGVPAQSGIPSTT